MHKTRQAIDAMQRAYMMYSIKRYIIITIALLALILISFKVGQRTEQAKQSQCAQCKDPGDTIHKY